MLFFTLTLDTEKKTKFELLYERYGSCMLYVAMDILKDQMEAEDAVHSSFIKILEHLDKITDVYSEKTKSFVLIITEHTAIDMIRKKHSERTISYETWRTEDRQVSRQNEANGFSQENRVVSAIKGMPPLYRDVFLLKYGNGYENREIAGMLGISEASVRKRISRGKKKLEEVLNGEGML